MAAVDGVVVVVVAGPAVGVEGLELPPVTAMSAQFQKDSGYVSRLLAVW